MKICRSCGETKELCRFPRNQRMSDGHINTCYKCVAADVLQKRRATGKVPQARHRDVVGFRFGRLQALRLLFLNPARWLCVCDCSSQTVVKLNALTNGHIRSCGCLDRDSRVERNRMRARNFEDLFLPEPNTGCWLWQARLNYLGYGNFQRGGVVTAHRYSWTYYRGPIPAGMHVLHRCDTPACVNPDHLFIGTHLDNMRDMVAKGRHVPNGVKGAAHHAAKLSDDDVRKIRAARALGEPCTTIARRHGVSVSAVSLIGLGRGWRHVA